MTTTEAPPPSPAPSPARSSPSPAATPSTPLYTEVTAIARHLMFTKVRPVPRGHRLGRRRGGPSQSSADIEIAVASVDSRDQAATTTSRSADFFDVENHPTMRFVSTGVRNDGGDWKLDGDLTVRGTTKAVTLDVEYLGAVTDPWGGKAGHLHRQHRGRPRGVRPHLERRARDRRRAGRQEDHHRDRHRARSTRADPRPASVGTPAGTNERRAPNHRPSGTVRSARRLAGSADLVVRRRRRCRARPGRGAVEEGVGEHHRRRRRSGRHPSRTGVFRPGAGRGPAGEEARDRSGRALEQQHAPSADAGDHPLAGIAPG